MKEGVEKAGLKAHYMSQPLAYHTPDCNCQGFIDLPEFPFSMCAPLKAPHFSLTLILEIKHSCVFPDRSGAQDSEQVGHAEVRSGGVQCWNPLHRRLLWVRTLSHPSFSRGARAWEGLPSCRLGEAWQLGQWAGDAHKALGQSQVESCLLPTSFSACVLFNTALKLRILHFYNTPSRLLNKAVPLHRARREYWENLKPASGRPFCPSLSNPDSWGVTKGHADLMQQKEATSQEQLKALFEKANKGQWARLRRQPTDRALSDVYMPKDENADDFSLFSTIIFFPKQYHYADASK